MEEYRITKYNPLYRNSLGYYVKNDWTSYEDIGLKFEENILTLEDYLEVEKAYIQAVIEVMNSNNLDWLTVDGLEFCEDIFDENCTNEMKRLYKKLKTNLIINISEVPAFCSLALRNYLWAKLDSDSMFVHFGYDYYMYIGSASVCFEEIEKIERLGLFVETFESPYKTQD